MNVDNVTDEETLRLELQNTSNWSEVYDFSHSVRFILKNEKGPK